MSPISSVYRVEIMSKVAILTRWSVFGIVLAAISRTDPNKIWHFLFLYLIGWFWNGVIKKFWILVTLKYRVPKWKIAKLFCGLLCQFLQTHSAKANFVERFGKKWQNNPQNSSVTFHFCTQQGLFWFLSNSNSATENASKSSKSSRLIEDLRCKYLVIKRISIK